VEEPSRIGVMRLDAVLSLDAFFADSDLYLAVFFVGERKTDTRLDICGDLVLSSLAVKLLRFLN